MIAEGGFVHVVFALIKRTAIILMQQKTTVLYLMEQRNRKSAFQHLIAVVLQM